MKSPQLWKPSKYDYRLGGSLTGSRNVAELSPSSRLITDRVAMFYSRAIPEYARCALLDLGCGKAPLYGLYRDRATSTVCADWELSLHENLLLDELVDLNKPLNFASMSYDTVILSDVLEHVEDPNLLMMEITRILKPGGTLLMNVPFLYWVHEAPHDYHRFTSFALRRLCAVAGLEVRELSAIGGVPEVLADLLAKHVIRIPLIGRASASFVQWIADLLTSKLKAGRYLSKKTAENCPLGYAMVAVKASAVVTATRS
ncbi:class I SAM-dependent methyltransferase [Mycolicibacterium gilvum]|uniref:class I SAM-dependent methyltransferase n=1 Tax=Mycolicibacterium gilvum TaxID=1804 RepID=UPI0040465F41